MSENQSGLKNAHQDLDQSIKKVSDLQNYGWDHAAISIYMNEVIKDNGNKSRINELNQQVCLIGSELYEKMFKESQLEDKAKIQLVMHQLGMGLNENNDLVPVKESCFRFDPTMPPGSSFLKEFAQTVQRAYPKGFVIQKEDKCLSKLKLKEKYPLETMIHQFRQQFDKQNIQFIKQYRLEKQLKTDEIAVKQVLDGKWFYADPQYHNRALLGMDIQTKDMKKEKYVLNGFGWLKKLRKHGFNRKILSEDYHSEFIIDESGMLISQWNQKSSERYEVEMPIMNGESFNYGERPAGDPKKSHHFLDGLPAHYFDPTKRRQIKRQWISPDDTFFYQIIRRLSEKGVRFKRK